MDEIEERLVACFRTVFPDLDEGSIQTLSNTSIAGWDSVATVTLIAVVEEEFGISVPLEEFDAMSSFEAARKMVGGQEEILTN